MKKSITTKSITTKFGATTVIAGLAALALTACGGHGEDAATEKAPVPAVASADVAAGSRISLSDASTSRSNGLVDSADEVTAPISGGAPATADSAVSTEVAPATTPDAPAEAAEAAPAAEAPVEVVPPVEDTTAPSGSGSSTPVVSVPNNIDLGKLAPVVSVPVTIPGVINPPSVTSIAVACDGTSLYVTAKVSAAMGVRSVTAQRKTIYGTYVSTNLVVGSTPGHYEGTLGGWFDTVSVTVTDSLGRSATDTLSFVLLAC